ncbi:MAG: hypothetical protein B6U95_06470 [Thermofilum sp. ex4484_82]|nr:MAG: hypothetical protein B6U95_06470 [Thermofilum sp. ex4484_82]OYT37508.1 MAG: hypothetical protein B6U96_06460 [Archaeoglobales archaeon ex4484_92]
MGKLYDIYFIKAESGECLFHFKFGSVAIDPNLVSGFLQAIGSFAQQLIPGEKSFLRTIDRGDFKIMIEKGAKVFAVLVAEEDTPEVRQKLKGLLQRFEYIYGGYLDRWEQSRDVTPFQSFLSQVLIAFPEQPINPRLLPRARPERISVVESLEVPDALKMRLVRVLRLADGKRSLEEIAEIVGLPVDEVISLFLLAARSGVVDFPFAKIFDDDILVKTGLDPILIRKAYGEVGVKLIEACDGKKTVKEIADREGAPLNVVKYVFGRALRLGYVQLLKGD